MFKVFTVLLSLSLLSFSYFYKAPFNNATDKEASLRIALAKKNRSLIACAPQLENIDFEAAENSIPLLTGWGNYSMPVTTSNDSAAIYFEQGINMYYGFHTIEAIASFEKAIQFDASFAMAFWGKALAYGPNINDSYYSSTPEALDAMLKAKELDTNCKPEEKGLIDAMQVRYTKDTTQTRAQLNQLYADKMQALANHFTNNADIAALYADALMVQHPWDLYDQKGQPKTWTPEIVKTLETALKINPLHPGAAHYYIHAVEASDHPEKGLDAANELAGLMPGVAHVAHMPSHIYIRAGYYNEGVKVNERAVKGYYDYLQKFAPVSNAFSLYVLHNLHMQAACANMDGTYKSGMDASLDLKKSVDTNWLKLPGFDGIFVQYVYMTPLLTDIRFGKWKNILRTPDLPDSLVYASLLLHYGKGLAYARAHRFMQAETELKVFRRLLLQDQLKAKAPAYANAGIVSAEVAEQVLLGVIAEEKNDLTKAETYLQHAVAKEDAMQYNEPKDWIHPTRQYLGAILIKQKNFSAAEKIYKEDLQINPRNGWSLTGLAIALRKAGKHEEAAITKKAAMKAFERSDLHITKSVF